MASRVYEIKNGLELLAERDLSAYRASSPLPDAIMAIVTQLLEEVRTKSINTGYGMLPLDQSAPEYLSGMIDSMIRIPVPMTRTYMTQIRTIAACLLDDPTTTSKWRRSRNLNALAQHDPQLRFMYVGEHTVHGRSGLYIHLTLNEIPLYILLEAIHDQALPIQIFTHPVVDTQLFNRTISQHGIIGYAMVIECTGAIIQQLTDTNRYFVPFTPSGTIPTRPIRTVYRE